MEQARKCKFNDKNLVSIITPAYNCADYIVETIESVLSQTYTNWEMIIVNDKSTDNTKDVIMKYSQSDSRIKYIELKMNSGAAVARNTAIENSNGRYIAFLDADDRWKSEKLECQLAFMRNHNYGFTFSDYEYIIDANNNKQKRFIVPKKLNYNQALKNTAIGCLTVIIDREIIGNFSMPLIRRGQDNLTWLQILKKGHEAYGLNKCLAEYRIVNGSLSNSKVKALKRQWYNYRKVIKLPLLKCMYYYAFYILYNTKKYYFD